MLTEQLDAAVEPTGSILHNVQTTPAQRLDNLLEAFTTDGGCGGRQRWGQ
jgi:hypothetical protein